MIFGRRKTYNEIINTLINDYDLILVSSNIVYGEYSSLFYEKIYKSNDFDKIKFLIPDVKYNNYNVEISIYIGEKKYWNIGLVYKFLRHNEVVRQNYSKFKVFKKFFANDTQRYLNEIILNKNRITNELLEDFYKEFPWFVFHWA